MKNLKRAVLVDVSYSMADPCGDGMRKHDVVQRVMKETVNPLGLKVFWFSSEGQFGQAEDGVLPEPIGGTDMANAFKQMKKNSIDHIIFLTDGQPDDAQEAEDEAVGIKFDIIYIGPKPVPDFLKRLGKIQHNTIQDIDMLKSGSLGELKGKVQLLIGEKSSGTFFGTGH